MTVDEKPTALRCLDIDAHIGHHAGVGWLQRADERNQRRLEQDNVVFSDENLDDTINSQPGPAWAWAIQSVPVIGLVGEAAIVADAWRKKKRKGRR